MIFSPHSLMPLAKYLNLILKRARASELYILIKNEGRVSSIYWCCSSSKHNAHQNAKELVGSCVVVQHHTATAAHSEASAMVPSSAHASRQCSPFEVTCAWALNKRLCKVKGEKNTSVSSFLLEVQSNLQLKQHLARGKITQYWSAPVMDKTLIQNLL